MGEVSPRPKGRRRDLTALADPRVSPMLAYFTRHPMPPQREYPVVRPHTWRTIGGTQISPYACKPEPKVMHAGPAIPEMSPRQRDRYLANQCARLTRAAKRCPFHAGLTPDEREELTDA